MKKECNYKTIIFANIITTLFIISVILITKPHTEKIETLQNVYLTKWNWIIELKDINGSILCTSGVTINDYRGQVMHNGSKFNNVFLKGKGTCSYIDYKTKWVFY